MNHERKLLSWIFIAIIVVGALVYYGSGRAAESESSHVYDTQLAACVQGNPLRESVLLAITTAAETTANPSARNRYAEAREHMLEQPFIRANGSKECEKAVTHP